MSPRACRRILWVGFALTVPVPVLWFGPGSVPAARLLELGGISVAVMLAESARGAVVPMAALLILQGALYLGLLWLPAAGAALALARLSPRVRTGVALGLLGAVLIGASAFEIYHTPFAADHARAGLLRVYR